MALKYKAVMCSISLCNITMAIMFGRVSCYQRGQELRNKYDNHYRGMKGALAHLSDCQGRRPEYQWGTHRNTVGWFHLSLHELHCLHPVFVACVHCQSV